MSSNWRHYVECSGCDWTHTNLDLPNGIIYRLSAARDLRGQVCIGWCHGCNAIQLFENTDPVFLQEEKGRRTKELLEAKLDRQDRSLGAFGWLKALLDTGSLNAKVAYFADRLKQIVDLEDFLKTRPLGTKCLNCSSWNFEKLTDDFRHECGGKLQNVSFQTSARLIEAWLDVILNADGEIVGKSYGMDPDRPKFFF